MRVIVAGCGAGILEDLAKVPDRSGYAVFAVSRMMVDFPGHVSMGATVHHEMAATYRRGAKPHLRIASTRFDHGVNLVYDEIPYRNGSSGLYAVGLALLMGASRVICCGVPLDAGPHYYPEPNHFDVEAYRDPWRKISDVLRGRVFSMSGWTRELLGPPPL